MDGTFFAVDAISGDLKWRLESTAGQQLFSSSLSLDELARAQDGADILPLFVPSLDGDLYYYDKDLLIQVRQSLRLRRSPDAFLSLEVARIRAGDRRQLSIRRARWECMPRAALPAELYRAHW